MEDLYAPYTSIDTAPVTSTNSKSEIKTCCKRPFTICSIKTGVTECRSCKKKYKDRMVYLYSCEKCNVKDEETDKFLDLIKDNKINWTKCKTCGQEVEYIRKPEIEFI